MALTLLATNNAESTLASAISATDTSLIVSAGTGAEFPDAVAGESYFKLTLTDAATGSQVEIVNVVAKAGDIFTIERAQEGTLARAWAANDFVANMMTADTLNVIAQYTQQAGESAAQALEAANDASDYAKNKFTFYKTASDPDGTIAGLAATTDGQSFWVAQGPDALSAAWQYQNKSGVAVLQAKQPGTAAITGTIREFPTLAAAQADADAGNIPVGSTTYVRSTDGISLADEYINNAGTLQPTGRKMPSQQAVDDIEEQTRQAIDWLQRMYLGQQSQVTAISDTVDKSDANEIALQRIYLAQQLHTATLSEVDSQLAYLSPENQLSRLMIIQQLAVALSALEGFDPADTSTSSPPLLDKHFVFGEPAGIIRISVNSPNGVPPNKAAGKYPTTARIDVDGKVISFYSTLEVQGDTSAGFPKKNLNITFSSTADRDEDMDLKIGDIIPHDEWTFKANWIDNTHARQYASFLLWSQMMDSRRGWPKRDIDNCYVGKVGPDGFPTGARAHPIGYPAVLYVNDAFYGIGTLAVGKKKENYNIPKNDPLKIHISMDANTAWVDIKKLSTDAMKAQYSFKAPKTQTAATQAALEAWDAFASSGQADFTANIATKLDKNNAIDFYLLLAVIGATDLWSNDNTKNVQFITWDGVKWFFMPYDLDTTYGLKFEGTTISYLPDTVPGTDRSANLFWMKVRSAYGDDVNQRYGDLRNQGIFSPDNLYFLLKQFQSKYSPDLVKADVEKWPTQPSLNVTSIDQILTWFKARLAYLDT
ncbi:TPA: CotH kinase family protein, partial [Klebsiella quasipneumoniae subsp. similipneumoniae]|nr:CotH kinase family protein [Klebsiella quasipneumoniae subsp. similipneumoniae]